MNGYHSKRKRSSKVLSRALPKVLSAAMALAAGSLSLLLLSRPASANQPLEWARIDFLRNRVQLVPNQQRARRARISDILSVGDSLRTAQASRAELRFSDGSLARIGERATFRFTPNTRNFQLTNGTVLLLIPPERGRSTIQTPNAVTGIQGSALFVRYIRETDTTIVGALTDNPNGPMVLFNRDGSEQQALRANEIGVIEGDQITQLYQFDGELFWQSSGLAEGFNYLDDSSSTGSDALDAVRQEIRDAISNQRPLDSNSVIENPGSFSLPVTDDEAAPTSSSEPGISTTASSGIEGNGDEGFPDEGVEEDAPLEFEDTPADDYLNSPTDEAVEEMEVGDRSSLKPVAPPQAEEADDSTPETSSEDVEPEATIPAEDPTEDVEPEEVITEEVIPEEAIPEDVVMPPEAGLPTPDDEPVGSLDPDDDPDSTLPESPTVVETPALDPRLKPSAIRDPGTDSTEGEIVDNGESDQEGVLGDMPDNYPDDTTVDSPDGVQDSPSGEVTEGIDAEPSTEEPPIIEEEPLTIEEEPLIIEEEPLIIEEEPLIIEEEPLTIEEIDSGPPTEDVSPIAPSALEESPASMSPVDAGEVEALEVPGSNDNLGDIAPDNVLPEESLESFPPDNIGPPDDGSPLDTLPNEEVPDSVINTVDNPTVIDGIDGGIDGIDGFSDNLPAVPLQEVEEVIDSPPIENTMIDSMENSPEEPMENPMDEPVENSTGEPNNPPNNEVIL